MKGIRNPLTDNHGNFDVGNIMFAVWVIAMVVLAWVDVYIHGNPFKAQELGIGVASGIAALGAYKYGDSKSPPPPAGG
jgi:hypothetical protein